MRHFVENGLDLRHHILPINEDRCTSWGAKRHVQGRSVFRNVDLLPTEHGVNSCLESGLLRQLYEKLDCLVTDPILRIIEIDSHGFCSHAFATCRITGEEIAEV